MNKQKGLSPIVIVLILAVLVGGYLLYQNKTKHIPSPIQTTETAFHKTFTLGNFTVSQPDSEIAKSEGDFYGQVHKTKLTDGECAYVEGINSLGLEKTYPPVEEGESEPTIWFVEWDTKSLEFDSKDSEQTFIKRTNDFARLSDYQNETKLRDLVLTDKIGEIPYTQINLNSCAGSGFSIPFLIKKVDSDKFDLAYFLEVTEGNGDVYSYPTRTLVMHHNDSWVIIKEGQGVSPDNWLCVKNYKRLVPDKEYLKCAIDTWAKEHRNEAENQKWIQKMLDNITYKN